jgi:site-specific recombinase XerD
MKERILTRNQIAAFAEYLKNEEKSQNTINKYIRDVSMFAFLEWSELKVKFIKLQRQVYCPEEKELNKAEYMRLII